METQIILNYIAIWAWQILAILFLLTSFIMFVLPRTTATQSFYVALFLIFVGCEYMSLRRKKELQDE